MSLFYIVFLYAIALHARFIINALECYTCTNATSLGACGKVIQCPSGSICHKEYKTLEGKRHFTLGCKYDSSCPAATGSGTLVGRSVDLRSADTCSECCGDALCNRQLCQHDYPNCADNTDVNCNLMGTMTPICTDTRHIINVCKRFCGLCSLVDGAWSQWGSWTNCDVTCENGTKSHTRYCDNPRPAYGGDNCVGETVHSEMCAVDTPCPVDGGWAPWSSWDACSTTCDIGLKKRHRSCANPDPSFNGRLCHGDSHEEMLCYPGACADGRWSSWNSWSTCTVTCGGGLTSRIRSCDNPAPSITGKYCKGDSKQTSTCSGNPCYHTVSFSAHDISDYGKAWTAGDHLIFTTVQLNEGGGYNKANGIFTAPRGGTYLFTVQICVNHDEWLVVHIMANGVKVGLIGIMDKDYDTCGPGTALISLSKGARVWVIAGRGLSAQSLTQNSYALNTFSGVLIGI